MFSSVSILLVGNNSLANTLRALTSIELYLNADFYHQHPDIVAVSKKTDLFPFFNSVYNLCFSDAVFHNTEYFNSELVKAEAINSCVDKIWSSFMCVLALPSVIRKPLTIYYPNFGEMKLNVLFNRTIKPRINNDLESDLKILFCSLNSPSKQSAISYFKANHFVPLMVKKSLPLKRKFKNKSNFNSKLPDLFPPIKKNKTENVTLFKFFSK